MRSLACPLVGILSLAAAGSVAGEPPTRVQDGPAARTCNAALARSTVGRRYTDLIATRARDLAGARTVRKIEPGRVYTMELRADRLSIEVNGRKVVTSVRCG